MKRIALSALNGFCAFGLVIVMQASALGQMSVRVVDDLNGSVVGDGLAHGFAGPAEGTPGPEEFITAPEYRAFSATEDGSGPIAPFYSLPTHNYTGWFRPRAAGRGMGERCYGDTFRPRGLGRLFARNSYGQRMDYKPYALQSWGSKHGPAYYQHAEDPRCPHCDKQGSCLSSLCNWSGKCGSCGGGSCGDGGCDSCGNGGCDSCDGGGCSSCIGSGGGLFGKARTGWSQLITRPQPYRDGHYYDGSAAAVSFGDGGCASCQASGSQGCASCQPGGCTDK